MGKLKPRGEELWCAAGGMSARPSIPHGVCSGPGPRVGISQPDRLSLHSLGEGREGLCQCPHWDEWGAVRGCFKGCCFKGCRVLPGSEDLLSWPLKNVQQWSIGVCGREFWAEEAAWGRSPRLGRVQCVFVDRKRMHGLRWMEEMTLGLISLCLAGSACSHSHWCLFAHTNQATSRLQLRERESELEGIATDNFLHPPAF